LFIIPDKLVLLAQQVYQVHRVALVVQLEPRDQLVPQVHREELQVRQDLQVLQEPLVLMVPQVQLGRKDLQVHRDHQAELQVPQELKEPLEARAHQVEPQELQERPGQLVAELMLLFVMKVT